LPESTFARLQWIDGSSSRSENVGSLGPTKDRSLARDRRFSHAVAATLLAVVFLAAVFRPADAGASAGGAHAAKAKQRLTAKQRRVIRQKLAREVKRNPTVVLKKSFVQQAVFVDYKLPMTVRLARPNGLGGYEPSDDQLEITWDDSANPWPLAGATPAGAPATAQLTSLNGRFTLEASFSDDASGYGELGAMETFVGGGISMTATPFTVSEFDPLCGTGPQLAVNPSVPVPITSAGGKYGVLNLFSGEMRGSLSLRMAPTTIATDGCGGTAGSPFTVDNSTATAMPLRYQGKFVISPSITADGKLRFGRLTIDDAVTPQLSTFASFRACSGVLACNPLAFPARLKLKKLTAEVLLGGVAP
jgi:hypothetical protein